MPHPLLSRTWDAPEHDPFVEALDARIGRTLAEIHQSELWQTLLAEDTDPALVRLMMREVYLEIWGYQPQVIEATIAIISRMPKTDPKMIQRMLIHQSEEADHGEMALRDYGALGGDIAAARRRRPSPAAFAVSSIWWGLWRMEDPFAYLGALYPFEGLTPIVSQAVLERLSSNGRAFPANALEFVTFHDTEDVKHANLVRKLLKYVAHTYPSARESIVHGLECFLAVYPIPVWETAFRRARREYEHATGASKRSA